MRCRKPGAKIGKGIHAMRNTRVTSRDYGASLLAVSGAAGLGISLANDFSRSSTIGHTDGALLVTVSTGLILAAALVIVALSAFFDSRPTWLRILLDILLVLGLVGTALAAYFLETNLLILFMAVGLIGWFAHVLLHSVSRSHVSVEHGSVEHGGAIP
jgi:hypothetical protein